MWAKFMRRGEDVGPLTRDGGMLSESLTVQGRYSEAEPLLLSSYEGIKSTQGADSPRTKRAVERLVTLYENWKRADKAAEYKSRS